jgi:indolepyruvate ferredoxin oxidoreductase, alpha subunit
MKPVMSNSTEPALQRDSEIKPIEQLEKTQGNLNKTNKVLLSGNEAIARGCYEHGVKVASAYPGTPSSEIIKNIATYDEIYAEWATNEKVAMEVAIGGSIGGVRSITSMKSAGANVACDPLVAFSYTGVNGGMVIAMCGDPGMASSSTEQDDRYFTKLANCPMVAPSTSQEAKDFVGISFEISERFDIPVILQSTTGLSHSKTEVELCERKEVPDKGFERNIPKYALLPAFTGDLRKWSIEREKRLAEYAEVSSLNRIEKANPEIGIIASGMAYQAAKEVMPDASFLKLGMVSPLPMYKLKKFAESVDRLFVVEELDPFFELQIRAAGIKVEGKELFSLEGELTPEKVARGFLKAGYDLPRWNHIAMIHPKKSVRRMPVQCAGCPHRGISMALKKLNYNVTGDIGCYDLITLPPMEHMHTVLEMGSAIGAAIGTVRAGKQKHPTFAVIGDSTFLHSGMTGLLNATYNKTPINLLILNNSITAMTGGQYNPSTDYTIKGVKTAPVSIPDICKALGVKHFCEVDPYDYKACLEALKNAVKTEETSVIMTNRPCALYPKKIKADTVFEILSDECTACGICVKKVSCPALILTDETNAKGKRKAGIRQADCTGCSVCAQLCRSDAIREKK